MLDIGGFVNLRKGSLTSRKIPSLRKYNQWRMASENSTNVKASITCKDLNSEVDLLYAPNLMKTSIRGF